MITSLLEARLGSQLHCPAGLATPGADARSARCLLWALGDNDACWSTATEAILSRTRVGATCATDEAS